MAKKSEKKEEENEDPSIKQLDSYLKKHKDDHLNFEEEVDWRVSTGSLLFDVELGGQGFWPGAIKAHGSTGAGKSSCVANCVKNFLETVPNSKAIWCKAEGRLDKKFRDMTGVKFVFSAKEWVVGTCFVFESNIFEAFIDMVNNLIKSNPKEFRYAIVADSMDSLIRRDDMVKDAAESEKVGAGGLLTSTMFKKAGLILNKKGHIFFPIHQVRSKVETKRGPKDMNKSVGGGGPNAVAHGVNNVWEFQPRYKSNNIEEDGKVVGHWCHIVATKGTDEKVYVEIKYPVKHRRKGGNSVWIEYEIAGLLIQWGLVDKSGSWLTLTENLIQELNEIEGVSVEEGFKLQGEANLKGWLEENPEITKYLYNKFLKLLSV